MNEQIWTERDVSSPTIKRIQGVIVISLIRHYKELCVELRPFHSAVMINSLGKPQN